MRRGQGFGSDGGSIGRSIGEIKHAKGDEEDNDKTKKEFEECPVEGVYHGNIITQGTICFNRFEK